MKSQLSFLAILATFQLTAAAAQDTQFVKPLSGTDLTPNQNRALNEVKELRTTEGELQVVQINPAPLRDVMIPLSARSSVTLGDVLTDISSDRTFSAIASIPGLPKGTTTLAVNGDAVTGSIQTDRGLYRIKPLSGGAHVIYKTGRFTFEHPPSIEVFGSSGTSPGICLR